MYGDIPYMEMSELYNRFYLTGAQENYPDEASRMTVAHVGNVHVATAYDGTAAMIDVGADTMRCRDLNAFTSCPFYTLRFAHEPEFSSSRRR